MNNTTNQPKPWLENSKKLLSFISKNWKGLTILVLIGLLAYHGPSLLSSLNPFAGPQKPVRVGCDLNPSVYAELPPLEIVPVPEGYSERDGLLHLQGEFNKVVGRMEMLEGKLFIVREKCGGGG